MGWVEKYYPGDDYVDALGSDIYPVKDTNVVFRQEWYDKMKKLANGKPLGLSENSVIPSEEILKIYHGPGLCHGLTGL